MRHPENEWSNRDEILRQLRMGQCQNAGPSISALETQTPLAIRRGFIVLKDRHGLHDSRPKHQPKRPKYDRTDRPALPYFAVRRATLHGSFVSSAYFRPSLFLAFAYCRFGHRRTPEPNMHVHLLDPIRSRGLGPRAHKLGPLYQVAVSGSCNAATTIRRSMPPNIN